MNYSESELKRKVQAFWDGEPCESPSSHSPEGSHQFFEEIERERYLHAPSIPSFAQFSRWHGKRVLEIGTGLGTDFLQFARAGADVYGIDLSGHSLKLAKEMMHLYGKPANIVQADAEDLPFPSNFFDLVYSWGVIHHSPAPPKVVEEIYRVLKPGGVLKAMLYNRHSVTALALYVRHGLLKGRPFRSFSSVLAQFNESPGTKAYTSGELKRMFQSFSEVKIKPDPFAPKSRVLGKIKMPWLGTILPDSLGFWMLAEAVKPSQA